MIGRSGAGKSTLLRMISRLVDPSEGRVVCDGVDVMALRGTKLREWRAICPMILPQFNLIGRLGVLTNVLMGRRNRSSGPTSILVECRCGAADKIIALSALEQ